MKFLHYIFTVGLFLVAARTYSQTHVDKTQFDFGDLLQHSERFIDFKFSNSGKKTEFILRIKTPREVTYRLEKDNIIGGGAILVRFNVNPTQTGYFSYNVEVYTSDRNEAYVLRLYGNAKELNTSSDYLTACPDFSQQRSAPVRSNFDLTVLTVEKGSGKPLAQSLVSFIQNGEPLGQWKTKANGEITQEAESGYMYFYASHPGYFPSEKGSYIQANNRYIVLELRKNPAYQTPPVIETQAVENASIAENQPLPKRDTQVIRMPVSEQIELFPRPLDSLPKQLMEVGDLAHIPTETFDEAHFKPNNIVFVLDISMSMNTGDKMELMKYALNSLAAYIRPCDKVSIITYASTTQMVLSGASGSEIEKIKSTVESLKGGGFTAGGAGIKLGYKTAKSNYIENGNNQVIVITDGAFNRDSDDYKKTIKKQLKSGYTMSVVGIQNKAKEEEEMRSIAKMGAGRYVPIFKLEDARWNLIFELREASFKH